MTLLHTVQSVAWNSNALVDLFFHLNSPSLKMVASRSPYCGISWQRVTQCIGIADVCLGIINFGIMLFRLKEATGIPQLQFSFEFVTDRGFSLGTFPAATVLPLEFAIASLVCYAIEFNMGAVLYIGATKRNLSVIYFWMIVTAGTASFTGPFIRIYELGTVYHFARRLKDDEEISDISAHYQRNNSRLRANGRNGPLPEYRENYVRHTIENQNMHISPLEDFQQQQIRYFKSFCEAPPPTYEEALTNYIK